MLKCGMRCAVLLLLANAAVGQMNFQGTGTWSGPGELGSTVAPPPSSNDPQLPQQWVDPDPVIAYSVTKYVGNTANGCPTNAGSACDYYSSDVTALNSVMNGWAAAADQAWHVVVTHGAKFTSAGTAFSYAVKNGASKYIVFESDTPLSEYRTVCTTSGSVQDKADGTSPRNPGCANDLPSMWTLEQTQAGTKIVQIPARASYVILKDVDIHPLSSLTSPLGLVNAGVNDSTQTTLADVPHHIGFDRWYIHGWDPGDPGTGANGTNIANALMVNAAHFWMANGYSEKIHSNGQESHVFTVLNTPGPLRFSDNFFEGGSIGSIFGGGALGNCGTNCGPTAIPGVVPSDAEFARNRWTKDPNWINLTGFKCGGTCAQNWGIKNAVELKVGRRVLHYGEIIEYSWNDGQTGHIILNQIRICSSNSACDSRDANGQLANIEDVLYEDLILRHGAEGFVTSPRTGDPNSDKVSFSTGGGVSGAMARMKLSNVLMYDVGDNTRFGNSNYRNMSAGGAFNTFGDPALSQGGLKCTLTRNAAGTLTTGVCPPTEWGSPVSTLGYTYHGMKVGDAVEVFNCTTTQGGTTPDTSFEVGALSTGPLAVAPTDPTTLSFTYPNAGTPNAVAYCSMSNGQGFPKHFKGDHVTIVAQQSRAPSSAGQNFASGNEFTNSIFTVNRPSPDSSGNAGMTCPGTGKSEGVPSSACWDTATLKFDRNVYQGRDSARYAGLGTNYFPGSPSGNTSGFVCSGASATSACIGFEGYMSGAAYPPADWDAFDYHKFKLHSTSAFKSAGIDGEHLGADIDGIDAAMNSNVYTCATDCTSGGMNHGPYGRGSASEPGVSLSPTSLTLGSQNIGTTSGAQSATLTNIGTTSVSISSIAASGDFAQTNNCGTSLAVSSSCTLSVTFTPTQSGTRTGTLTVTDSAPGSPHTVALSGTGQTTGGVMVTVLPSTSTVVLKATQQFTATVTGSSNHNVTWDVNGVVGGNSTLGTVSTSGLYTAPNYLPNPASLMVRAVSQADNTKSATANAAIDRGVTWSSDCNFNAFLTTQKGTNQTCTYTVGPTGSQETRQVRFRVPNSYANGNPGMIWFHGNGSSGSSLDVCEGAAKMRTEADQRGFVIACPQGESGGSSTRGWMSWWMPSTLGPIYHDTDLAWAILKDMETQLRVDPKRRYATGFSGGSNFTGSALVVEDGALLAAIGVVEGAQTQWDTINPTNPAAPAPPTPAPNYPVAVFMSRGYLNATDGTMAVCDHPQASGGYIQATMQEDFDYYKNSFHCSSVTPNTNSFCSGGRGSAPSGETWKVASGCDGGVVVHAYAIVNGAHQWYTAHDISGTSGAHNSQLRINFPNSTPTNGTGYTQDILWDFFSQHVQP